MVLLPDRIAGLPLSLALLVVSEAQGHLFDTPHRKQVIAAAPYATHPSTSGLHWYRWYALMTDKTRLQLVVTLALSL